MFEKQRVSEKLTFANDDEKKSLLTIEDVDSENVHDTDEDVKK